MANSDVLVRMKADTRNYDANIAKARRQLDQFKKDNLSLGGVMKQTTSAMVGMAAQFASVAAAIGAAKKVIGDMVRINKEFEQGTANLASIIGQSREEIVKLTNQAKQLGAATRYTAMQITELQTNLARLGFTQQEILNSTTAVQALATATGADLGEAANLAGAALRGFGLNATEMERVASVLAVSTTKSALSFDKLATAVPIVAPVAKQFGFTIEDTVTLLGKLSDAGMDASTAATATRNIFLKMANDSGKLAQALGRPVHSVEEFGEALAEMRKKGMSLNDILQMVGVRSTAAFAVFADNAETLKDFKQSITDCGDAMHDMESKQIDTLQGSLIILNSAWEGLMLSFNESTGPIKTAVDALTELLQAWTKWRNRNQGGDAAIQSYELSDSKVAQYGKQYIEADRASGMSDEAIKRNAENEVQAITSQRDAMRDLLKEWEKAGELGWGSKEIEALIPQVKALFGNLNGAAYQWSEQMQKAIAGKNDSLAINNYIVSALSAPTTTDTQGKGGGVGGGDKTLTSKRRAQIEAQMQQDIAALDKANMIKEGKEEEYEDQVYAIKKAALEQILKLYDEDSKEYAQVKAKMAQEDIRYQGVQMRLAKQTEKDEKKNLTNLQKRQEKIDELTDSIKEMQTILESDADANTKAWATTQLKEYQTELDKLNGKLTDVATNAKTQFDLVRESLDKFGSGIGAVSTLGNALNNLKNIGEDLASAFSGEMDAWDALMTVFNSGIGILDTVISVMDAINTVQELSIALSGKRKAEQALETAEVVGGKMAEATAEGTEAAASGAAAGANAAEGATAAGKSVAWIPIVGPILAAAAIAATIGAMIAAMSKAKSAGSFSTGGVVGGNSNSGDRLMAYVNSGETILTPQQADKAMAGIQGGGQTVQVQGQISGTNILLVASNAARQMNRNGGIGHGGNSVALPLIG